MSETKPRSTYFSTLLGLLAIPLSAALILLPILSPESPSELAGWDTFTGRLHPMMVHFPIVLVALPLILWLVMGLGKRETFRGALPWIWGLAVASSLVSVVAGYLLYRSGEYGGELVKSHFWAGVGVAVASIWCAWTYARFRRTERKLWRNLYVLLLLIANGIVVYAGHLGGSLTHGENFLTESLPFSLPGDSAQVTTGPDLENPKSLRIYNDMLLPAFTTRCMSCHNRHKAKGGLVMASLGEMTKGGKSDKPAIVVGQPDSSEVYLRVALAHDHDDHMPPEGKKPLEREEIAMLRWWIEQGANPADTLGEEPEDPTFRQALLDYMPRLAQQRERLAAEAEKRKKLAPELAKLGEELGLVIQPDIETDSMYFVVSMEMSPKTITDETLSQLQEYATAFSRISLVSAEITDDGLYYFSQMPNLQKLLIQKTCVDGSGLVHLKDLPQLEILNLSHTNLTDEAALQLTDFPALRQVFVFNTQIGENLVAALDKHLRRVKVSQEEGPYY